MPATTVRAPRLTRSQIADTVTAVEQYLAKHAPRRRTAHPLVTKTTAELVEESRTTRLFRGRKAPAVEQRLAPDLYPVTVPELLHLTVMLLERRGWAQNTMRNEQGGVCAIKAMRILRDLGYSTYATEVQAVDHVHAHLKSTGHGGSLIRWNDDQTRTFAQVTDMLRAAAKTAR